MFSVTKKSSVPRNLKGCQTLGGGKATGRHPRKVSANQFDPGEVAEFADIFFPGTTTGVLILRSTRPVVSILL